MVMIENKTIINLYYCKDLIIKQYIADNRFYFCYNVLVNKHKKDLL